MSVTHDLPQARTRYRTAAEWHHDLGDVPLDRILFDPPPCSATEADLLRKIEVEKQLCELIDGTLVEKPMGWYESILAMLLGRELLNFILPRRLGIVAGPDGPLRMRIGLVRLTDVSFISADQLRKAGGVHRSIPSLIPDLAVEILSPGNRPGEMRRKLREYFEAGVRLVWYIDPMARTVEVYRSVDQVRRLQPDAMLSGEGVLPGLEIRLGDLFSAADDAMRGMC